MILAGICLAISQFQMIDGQVAFVYTYNSMWIAMASGSLISAGLWQAITQKPSV